MAEKNGKEAENKVQSKASENITETMLESQFYVVQFRLPSADYLEMLSSLAIYIQQSSRIVQCVLYSLQRALAAKVLLDGYSPRIITPRIGSWEPGSATAGTVGL